MNTLWLIPARGGSKGIKDKNLKPFCGESLTSRATRQALDCASKNDTVFVSTDSLAISLEARKAGIEIPFLRSAETSSDSASTYSVIIETLDNFRSLGKEFDRVVLLQPTSPLRTSHDIMEACKLWHPEIDMVVSVNKSKSNPYYNLFEVNQEGFLKISKGDGNFTRRQDAPPVWEYNGAVYVMSKESLLRGSMSEFKKVIPYEMPSSRSIDLDTPDDWSIAEIIFSSIKNEE